MSAHVPGRHRCQNEDQNVIEYKEVHNSARQATRHDNSEILTINVVCHVVSTAAEIPRHTAELYVSEVFETINQDFGQPLSESHIFTNLNWSKYPLFANNSDYRAIFSKYLACACSANIKFERVHDIQYYTLKTYDETNQSLAYWDDLIKIKTAPAIEPERYLQLWIMLETNSPFLGYAQFPKVDRTAYEVKTDGVVFFVTTQPFHLFKTVTHELGHWLGLNHVFHKKDNIYTDAINDTPYQEAPCYGDPLMEKEWPKSTHNETASYHMFMNYMDYTNDIRMSLFTKEQVAKMRSVLLSVRKSYLASTSTTVPETQDGVTQSADNDSKANETQVQQPPPEEMQQKQSPEVHEAQHTHDAHHANESHGTYHHVSSHDPWTPEPDTENLSNLNMLGRLIQTLVDFTKGVCGLV